ncbi:hypothetical protein BGZ65_005110 [Modicella reniformis]|uniref:Uncharacterized protein n=1 Tax=Modicella reniformis TaxID=1440133 RepID=A0A9P6IZL2_9FUNG|nr:hypothetical protein BGZ65_005110 [Modicella reniformis]
MKLSKATTLFVLCAATLLVAFPAVTQAAAEIPELGGDETTTKTTASHTTTTSASPTTTITTTTVAPTTTAASTAAPTTTTRATTTTTTAPQSKPVITSIARPTSVTPPSATTSSTLPPSDGSCVNSSTCLGGQICALTSANTTTGTCVLAKDVCPSEPLQTCSTSAECPTAYSYCTTYNNQMVCTGLGLPGTKSECKPSDDNSGLTATAKYAGVAVGSVAALAVVFALVRRQRRRQRARPRTEMFGEIDYGMSGGSAKGVESYPFSSRQNGHGNDNAPPPSRGGDYGYDNNQHYEEPIGYAGKMHQDQYYGYDQYSNNNNNNNNNNNQYYGNGGYDQRGGDGFYDNSGYDGYQQGGHPVSPPVAARSPRQNFNTADNYSAEPSEQDFGGQRHDGHGGHGRY